MLRETKSSLASSLTCSRIIQTTVEPTENETFYMIHFFRPGCIGRPRLDAGRSCSPPCTVSPLKAHFGARRTLFISSYIFMPHLKCLRFKRAKELTEYHYCCLTIRRKVTGIKAVFLGTFELVFLCACFRDEGQNELEETDSHVLFFKIHQLFKTSKSVPR